MASRSPRQKIRYHASKLNYHLDRMIEECAAMTAIADGRHPYLDEAVPMMIASIEEFREMVDHFFSGL